jgi:hypothetical protein
MGTVYEIASERAPDGYWALRHTEDSGKIDIYVLSEEMIRDNYSVVVPFEPGYFRTLQEHGTVQWFVVAPEEPEKFERVEVTPV